MFLIFESGGIKEDKQKAIQKFFNLKIVFSGPWRNRTKMNKETSWWANCIPISMKVFNAQYISYSYSISTVQMESVSKNTIFGLKMMVVKSGLETFILKSLHTGRWLFLLLNLWFWCTFMKKGKKFPAKRDFKVNFSRPLFTIIFRTKAVFFDTDFILRVKTMVEQLIYCVLSRTGNLR